MSPGWKYLLIAIAAEVIATSALKASASFTRIVPAGITVLGYGLAFYLLALALKTIPVGIAYAVWSGAGVVAIALIGYVVFGQRIGLAGIIGISLILAGVLVLNLFAADGSH